MRNQPGGRRESIVREKSINPFVRPVSPELCWDAEDGEWIALGFEVIAGRPSSFATDSPDLPKVVGLLDRIGDLELPEVAREWQETRLDRFATDTEKAFFRGDALLHSDINPDNLIVGSRGAWAVDWAWPTRGAAFLDPARLVIQLVSSGHSPASAESWAAGCAAWAKADPRAIDAFAAARVRMHWTFTRRKPQERWLRAMAEAAEAWARHRGVTVV
ncbi:protein kinase [Streptomyces xiamenensis]